MYFSMSSDPKLMRKPKRKLVAQGPDYANFVSTKEVTKKEANWGLEMLKFLPKFEQMMYAGKYKAKPGEGIGIEHGKYLNGKLDANGTPAVEWVTPEWYEAFNEYNMDGKGLTAGNNEAVNPDALRSLFAGLDDDIADNAGYNPHTNEESIKNYENIAHANKLADNDPNNNNDWADGYTSGAKQSYVFGQHHRVGKFGILGSGTESIAGAGEGEGFANLDFITEANEWNHIKLPKSSKMDGQAAVLAEKPEFINSYLSTFYETEGEGWAAMKGVIDSLHNPDGSAQSFYQMVMSKSYQNLTPANSFLLIAAMYESRERSFQMMKDTFGDVTHTQTDQAMIADLKSNYLLANSNSTSDHHALSLFPFFLQIQHSFINGLTMFYQKVSKPGRGDGYNDAVLDKVRFIEFVNWMGRATYDDTKLGDLDNANGKGKLYQYRQSYKLSDIEKEIRNSGSYDDLSDDAKEYIGDNDYGTVKQNLNVKMNKYNKIGELIDKWFGATDDVNKPRWADYGSGATENGGWTPISLQAYVTAENGEKSWKYITSVQLPTFDNTTRSYGYDRKWSGIANKNVKYMDGNVEKQGVVGEYTDQVFIPQIMSKTGIAHINYKSYTGHANYTSAQFNQLSFNEIVAGEYHNNNWVVFAMALYYSKGVQKDMTSMLGRSAQKRQVSADFKKDVTTYMAVKERVEDEQEAQERAAAKAVANRKRQMAAKGGGRRVGPVHNAKSSKPAATRRLPPPPPPAAKRAPVVASSRSTGNSGGVARAANQAPSRPPVANNAPRVYGNSKKRA